MSAGTHHRADEVDVELESTARLGQEAVGEHDRFHQPVQRHRPPLAGRLAEEHVEEVVGREDLKGAGCVRLNWIVASRP